MGAYTPVYHQGERIGAFRPVARKGHAAFQTFLNVQGQRQALRIVPTPFDAQSVIRSAWDAQQANN